CHRRLACEPGGCSAPVAGYSACLTSFTSSIRFSLHAYEELAFQPGGCKYMDRAIPAGLRR
ncbi:hypothetical protein, partial [Escherichia coli]|uniref:hypothetical protein n=1 Tax=Escherichia coli TaxID=562 RepID=UPI001BFEDBE8